MKKAFLILTLCITTLTGCAKEDSKSFEKYMEEGKVAIANEEYDKGLNFFTLAKEENENNEELNSLYNQTKNLVEAIESKENKKYTVAIEICETISNIDSETNIIKQVAENLKKECEKLINEEDKNEGNKKEDTKKEQVSSNSQPTKVSKKQYFITKLSQIEDEVSILENSPEFTEGSTMSMRYIAGECYTLWDDLLNEIYGVLKTQLSQSEMSSLRNKQVNWIKYRDSEADKEAAEYEGGTMAPLMANLSNVELTRQRCYELVNNYIY